MTFKSGQSGNPKGRPKGAVGKRFQYDQLLEPHGEALVAKVVELALKGDSNALRICIDRLIPKTYHSPIPVQLDNLTTENSNAFKIQILQAALDGKISGNEAETMIQLISNQLRTHPISIPTKLPSDPVEASRVYQEIMR
jgi:uncharacterized protein DUF5681